MNTIRAARRIPAAANTGILKGAAAQLIYFGCGVLVSRGAVPGALAPFGASFLAAVPINKLLASMLGTALGYILLAPTDSFRYLAVVFAVGAIRRLFSSLDKINGSRFFAPLAASLPILATGAALFFGSTGTLSELSFVVIEAFLAAAAAYFFSETVRLSLGKRSLQSFTQSESACVVMSACVLLLSLGSLAIENVSVGRILAVTAVLLCARYGGVSGGAVSGISTGAVFSLAGAEQGFICAGYAFGGLTAGLFGTLGKLGSALGFLISDFFMSLALGSGRLTAATLIESAAGGAIFMLLPKSVGGFISPLFERPRAEGLGDTLRRGAVMRLGFVSKAIKNVQNDVENVSKKLGVMTAPGFESVCEDAAREVCSGCGLRMYCYEHEGGVTKDDFFRLREPLAEKGEIDERDVASAFLKTCCKKGEIARSMSESYKRLLSRQEARRRVTELRGVVAGQFAGVGEILDDLSCELETAMKTDSAAAERITSRLSELGLPPRECVCLTDGSDRMRVELTIEGKTARELQKSKLAREISRCCGRRLDSPSVSDESGRLRLTLCELPEYDVEIGTDQHIADNGKLCGDCIDYFNDGGGRTYAMICDGMGTGGRAAVDSNMAVSVMGRLLRAGLGADSSLSVVNTALMVKSEDESLSTIDLASIDLYTGELILRKAGAPATFIRKGGRVTAREYGSLPAGILESIEFAGDTVKLAAGDMVVMVSDGVITGDEKWLEQLIKSWRKGSTQELAQAVVEEAIRRRGSMKDDDITAVAIKLIENEE